MAKAKDLFRQEVIDEMSSPDELSSSIHVTRPSVYLILATSALMAVVLFIWLFFGSVSDKVSIGGVVFPTQDAASASIPNDGVVRQVFVHAGDYVQANQTLALVSVGTSYSIVSSPVNGVVVQQKNANDEVKAFDPIVSLVTQDTAQVIRDLTAFADFNTQRKLRKGMEVQVSPVNLPREQYGYVKGHIVEIGHYSMKKEQALRQLKMDDFINGVFPQDGNAFLIKIKLDTKVDNPNQLDWSFGQPKEADTSIGTFCNVQVVTKKRSMFDFLFGQVSKSINQILQ